MAAKRDSKRVEAVRKAAETRRRNETEKATERTRPLGPKPSVSEAKEHDTSARTAGLAVEKSGPGREPATTERTSPEAVAQAEQQSRAAARAAEGERDLPEPNAEQVDDARDRAKVEADRLAANRSQDQRIAPNLSKDELRDEAHEKRLKVMEEWNAPRRGQVTTAVAAVDGEVTVFTADGSVFIDTGGEARLTRDQTIDLTKQLQAAFQAVS